MRKRGLIAITVVAVAMVVLAGGLMASNMGFKLNYPMKAADGGVTSLNGFQTLSLPYNRQVGVDTAKDLFQDILAAGSVQNIQKFLPASDTYSVYQFGASDFALEQGVGYFVTVGPPNFSYIVVGSHNPSASIPLNAQGVGSLNGFNLFAPPYHGTASTAKELFQELGVAQNIQNFLPATDTFQVYQFAAADYPLVPGVAYFVTMGSSLSYQPSHY